MSISHGQFCIRKHSCCLSCVEHGVLGDDVAVAVIVEVELASS